MPKQRHTAAGAGQVAAALNAQILGLSTERDTLKIENTDLQARVNQLEAEKEERIDEIAVLSYERTVHLARIREKDALLQEIRGIFPTYYSNLLIPPLHSFSLYHLHPKTDLLTQLPAFLRAAHTNVENTSAERDQVRARVQVVEGQLAHLSQITFQNANIIGDFLNQDRRVHQQIEALQAQLRHERLQREVRERDAAAQQAEPVGAGEDEAGAEPDYLEEVQ